MQTGRPMWRSRAWLGAAITLTALLLGLSTIAVENPTAAAIVLALAAVVAVSVIGGTQARIRAQRRRYEDELAAWASERATHAERLRIAADLHDLVSHGLGLITVRAAAARTVAGPDAAEERADALADIEHAGRETATELRRMLTVLRDPGSAPLCPADSLADVPDIVQAANAAGLAASVSIDELGEVSPGAQLTVCAVVREGVNNALRHAGPTRAHVRVRREEGAVVVDVQDAGPAAHWPAQPGAGHGLDGLRDRVGVLGGTVDTMPAGDGFRLVARVPDASRR